MQVVYKECVGSTNDCVRDMGDEFALVYVGKQQQGRGQRGNSWESEPYKNLTFSFLLHPTFLPAEKQFELSMIVSLSIVATLEHYGLHPTIKWPNDIYIGSKKICGILIENDISGSGVLSRSVVGIGININQSLFLSDAPNPTSLLLESGVEHAVTEVLNTFCEEFMALYVPFSKSELVNIEEVYTSLLHRLGVVANYRDANGEFRGTIKGIAEWGTLVIEKESGEECHYQFKEVAYL